MMNYSNQAVIHFNICLRSILYMFGFNLLWPLFVGSSELANVPPVTKKKEKSDELKTN